MINLCQSYRNKLNYHALFAIFCSLILSIAGCQSTFNSTAHLNNEDGEIPLDDNTNPNNNSQRFGYLRTPSTTIFLSYIYLVSAPNPENKFIQAQWLLAMEKPLSLGIENPENIGIYLSKMERGVQLQINPDSPPILSVNLGYGWTAATHDIKKINQITIDQNASVQILQHPIGIRESYLEKNQKNTINVNWPPGPIKTMQLPIPSRPPMGKNAIPISANNPIWNAYSRYCEQNYSARYSLAAYEAYLKEAGRYPSKADIATLSKHFSRKISEQNLIESMYKQDQQRFLRMPTQCNLTSGFSDGRTAALIVEAELEGKRKSLEAFLQKRGNKWIVTDHSRWIPMDKS